LAAEEYRELRQRLEEAHTAIVEAATVARRAAMRARKRPRRRPDAWEPGYELMRLRKECGLSQWNLANLSGVSRPTIQRLEVGLREPRSDTREKLARALDVEPEWIWMDWTWPYDDERRVGVPVTSKLWQEMTPHIQRAARKYASKYGLGTAFMEDLVGAGEEGFLKGCESFDPVRGTDLRWWLRFKAVYGIHDEARRIHSKNRPGPSVDYLEEKGFELGY
jgi:DNA-binding XRE family transcriptional regulator